MASLKSVRILCDRRMLFLLVVICTASAGYFLGFTDILSMAAIRNHYATLTDFVSRHFLYAIAIFLLIYVNVVAFSLPGSQLLTITGGLLFGFILGTALAVIGATVGATTLFLVATRIFGKNATEKLGRRAMVLAASIKGSAWSYLLALRLFPLAPFFVVNLAAAFVGVPLRTFVFTTLFGIIPGSFVYSLSGAALAKALDAGNSSDIETMVSPELIMALVGLAALALLTIPVKTYLAKRKAAR